MRSGKRTILTCMVLAGLCGLVIHVHAQPTGNATEGIKSRQALNAGEAYQRAVSSAMAECDKAILAARKKYVDVLTASVKQATRAGDLQEAQALQKMQDRLTPVVRALPADQWNARYSHTGDRFDVIFNQSGVNLKNMTGQIRAEDDRWILTFPNAVVMRLTPIGDRFVIEEWAPEGGYAAGLPPRWLAIATRPEKKAN